MDKRRRPPGVATPVWAREQSRAATVTSLPYADPQLCQGCEAPVDCGEVFCRRCAAWRLAYKLNLQVIAALHEAQT